MKIDCGCGTRKKEGFKGVDILNLPDVDIVADLEKRLPFEDKSIDEINCSHTLEHLEDPISTLEEFHRVLKTGGILKIILPHFTNHKGFIPKHKHFFSITWLDIVDLSTEMGINHPHITSARFKIVKRFLFLQKHRFLPWTYIIEKIINRSYKLQVLYERFLAFVFPADECHWYLVKEETAK